MKNSKEKRLRKFELLYLSVVYLRQSLNRRFDPEIFSKKVLPDIQV